MAALKLSTPVALRTFGESSFQSRMIREKKKTVLIDIVIGFHDSKFYRMVLSCATRGLTLNIVQYGCGCDSFLILYIFMRRHCFLRCSSVGH